MILNEYKNPSHVILHMLIGLVTCVCFIFIFINFFLEKYFLASFELFGCLINLFLLITFKKIIQSSFVNQFILGYSFYILSSMMVIFFSDNVTSLVYVWIFLIPCIGYVVNGIRTGFWITGTFSAITFCIYLFNSHSEYGSFQTSQLLNVLFAILVAWILTHIYETIRGDMTEKLVELATLDPLTKLKNRGHFYKVYRTFTGRKVGLILLDLDCLKRINKQYGYLAGDVLLLDTAKILKRLTENKVENAHLFRIGDDEFAILMPTTDCQDCLTLSKKLFATISQNPTRFKNYVLSPNVSMALACIEADGNNLDELMMATYKLLKQAKQSDNDKIAVAIDCAVY